METDREVKTIQVNIKCPDCEIIMNRITQYSDDDNYNTYTYECHRCYTLHESDIKYPYIKYIQK